MTRTNEKALRRQTEPVPEPAPEADLASALAGGQGRLETLGAAIRDAREQRGLALRELARRLGVSPSLISQIERGRVMPSVGTLYAISRELELTFENLFNETKQPAVPARTGSIVPAVDSPDGPVQRAHNRQSIRLAGGVQWERLTARHDEHVEFLHVVYEVGATSCPPDALVRHGGKEYAYVLSGRLGLRVGFQEFELGPGDSVSFSAELPHRLWAIGDEPVSAIWVIVNRVSP